MTRAFQLDGLRVFKVTKRIFSALIIIPPLTLLIVFGPHYTLYIMVSVAAILGLYEFYNLTLPDQGRGGKIGAVVMGTILCGVFQWASYEAVVSILGVILLILFLGYPLLSSDLSTLPNRIGVTFFGIVYIPFLLSHITLINKLPKGLIWVLLLVATVWAGDTFALIVGSLWGRHKLCPQISPKKTIEGFLGCFVGAIVSIFAFKTLFLTTLAARDAIVVGSGIALFGQLGDLSESMIKRGANVKDSGALIPGHGGMLDRLDSFLFSSPFLYYFLIYKIYAGAI
ncbi:MAG: phosphatidate cytidylyltransferase [Deltaproteobacteria bacterium]|nr:MAG: phosphatidate cytidylyltransferase [Deltaproteobacteria bacterium]